MSTRAVVIALVLSSPLSSGAGMPLVELKTAEGSFRGRVVAKDSDFALLLDRDGVLRDVPLAGVTAYSIAEPSFRPYSAVDMRDRLLRIVGGGSGIDTVATPHYVVVGQAAAARGVGEALEEVYDGYRWYCSARKLPLGQPEFPLVAIVFPNRATFDEYCRADKVPPSPSLQGYYRDTTNRFVCYQDGRGITADLRDTLVHEAIHQVAFNTGLHARGGQMPLWAAEGFATALEPEAARRPLRPDSRPLDRANPERLARFLANADGAGRVRPRDLVESDATFQAAPLDAYAAAWAMTFYFMEAKPSAYAKYLRTLAARDPLAEYMAEERVADFRDAFGSDWTMLDADVARFQKRVAAGERR